MRISDWSSDVFSSDLAFDAVDVDRVVITHDDDRRRVVALAEVAGHVERLLQRMAVLQRALAGHLDRRTIGHRNGKGRNAFDDLRTRSAERRGGKEGGSTCSYGLLPEIKKKKKQ